MIDVYLPVSPAPPPGTGSHFHCLPANVFYVFMLVSQITTYTLGLGHTLYCLSTTFCCILPYTYAPSHSTSFKRCNNTRRSPRQSNTGNHDHTRGGGGRGKTKERESSDVPHFLFSLHTHKNNARISGSVTFYLNTAPTPTLRAFRNNIEHNRQLPRCPGSPLRPIHAGCCHLA